MTQQQSHPVPAAPHDSPAHGALGHVVPLRLLVTVFGALVVLTFLTVAVTWVDMGNFNLYVALAIALVKATLVALFFMHLLYDKKFNLVILLSCLIFFALFISFVLTDTAAYQSTKTAGQGAAMQGVHTPFGTGK